MNTMRRHSLHAVRQIARKLAGRRGFTLAEALVTVLIVLLVTAGLSVGVAFAARQYTASMNVSEAKMLESTLATVISNELEQTTSIVLGSRSGEESYEVEKFYSPTYAEETDYVSLKTIDGAAVNGKSYGELAFGIGDNPDAWNKLISSKSYTRDLGAYADIVYTPTVLPGKPAHFTVMISIASKSGSELVTDTFDVIPLNKVTASTETQP